MPVMCTEHISHVLSNTMGSLFGATDSNEVEPAVEGKRDEVRTSVGGGGVSGDEIGGGGGGGGGCRCDL